MKTIRYALVLAVLLAFVPTAVQASGSPFQLSVNGTAVPGAVFTVNPGTSFYIQFGITNTDTVERDYVTLLTPASDASWIAGFADQSGSLQPGDTKVITLQISPIHLGTRMTQLIVADPTADTAPLSEVILTINVFPEPEITNVQPVGAGPGESITIGGMFLKLPINAPLDSYGIRYIDGNGSVAAVQTCEDSGVTCSLTKINASIPASLTWGDMNQIVVFGPNGISLPYVTAAGPHVSLSTTELTGTYIEGDPFFHQLQFTAVSDGDRTAHVTVDPIESTIPICNASGNTSGDNMPPGKTSTFSFGFYTDCDKPGTYSGKWSVTVTDDRGVIAEVQTVTVTVMVVAGTPTIPRFEPPQVSVTLVQGQTLTTEVQFVNPTGVTLGYSYFFEGGYSDWLHASVDGGFLLPGQTNLPMTFDSTATTTGAHHAIWNWTVIRGLDSYTMSLPITLTVLRPYTTFFPIIGK